MARKLPPVDPLEVLPIRYEDRTAPAPVTAFSEGRRTFTRGTVTEITASEKVTVITMQGAGGQFLVKFFRFPPYYAATFRKGRSVSLMGTAQHGADGWAFSHPDPLGDDENGGIFAVYTTPKGISEKRYREHVWKTTLDMLPSLKDEIDDEFLRKRDLPTLAEALRIIHHPQKHRAAIDEKALLRLAYREIHHLKQKILAAPKFTAPVMDYDPGPYIDSLPFRLTGDQIRAIREIGQDMRSGNAMRRLLVGDVSTGKTEVAIAASKIARTANYRTLLLAPTTILAEQLYNKCVERLGKQAASIYTGENKHNPAWIIVGTSALMHRKFPGVGLVIIDETHKTGVQQRQTLLGPVHALQMTATPIPRTVGLILHGAVNTSALHQTPFPRDVATKVVSKDARPTILAHIRQTIKTGGKALVIYPYVSEARGDYQAVEEKMTVWEKLFPGQSMAVHGQLEDKIEIVDAFRASRTHNVLVATSLIENGLDIPEASILVVAGAEKFGISQLHQLRGRIGRRGNKSTCYFICYSDEAAARLKPLESVTSGFQIAEIDSEQRGFGDFFGVQQSGYSYKLPYPHLYKTVARWVTEDIFNKLQEKNQKEEV